MMYNYGAAILRAVGGYQTSVDLPDRIRSDQCSIKSVSGHCIPSGCSRRRDCDRYIPAGILYPGTPVPASHREQLSASPCKASDQIRVSEADF